MYRGVRGSWAPKAPSLSLVTNQAVATARRIGAPRTFFTHMCHDLLHAATDGCLPAGMALAYDGLVLELP